MENAIIPMADIERMGTAIAKSGLFGVKTPDQAIALCLVAAAEGRHPAEAARDYNIILGRPAKTSEAMLRDYLTHGGKVDWHRLDDTIADATFTHAAGGSVRITWDLARAEKAGLLNKSGDMFRKYPRQMLRARCVSEGVRTVCPMATSGMYVPEEVKDFEPMKDEPTKVVETTAEIVNTKPSLAPQPTQPDKLPWEENKLQGDMAGQPQEPQPTQSAKSASVISQPQARRLMAIGFEAGYNIEEIKAICKNHGFDHSKDITRDKYETICKELGIKK